MHLMTYFSAVEKTNKPQNYHKLPFVMIVIILTTSSLSYNEYFHLVLAWSKFSENL